MNFSVDGKHRDFYRKEGWIELEEMLTLTQREALLKDVAHCVKPGIRDPKAVAEAIFVEGHDLFRVHPSFKRVVLNKGLAGAACSLLEQKDLRIGCDQLFSMPDEGLVKEGGALSKLLSTSPTLQQLSSIQGVQGAFLLCLKNKDQTTEQASTLFALREGNGVFFSPTCPIDFKQLYARPGSVYLLIVYTAAKSVYIHQASTPHLNGFKKLGLSYGDRLTDALNPLVST